MFRYCPGLNCSSQLKHNPLARLSVCSAIDRRRNGGNPRGGGPNKDGCDDPPVLVIVGDELRSGGDGLLIVGRGGILRLETAAYSSWNCSKVCRRLAGFNICTPILIASRNPERKQLIKNDSGKFRVLSANRSNCR